MTAATADAKSGLLVIVGRIFINLAYAFYVGGKLVTGALGAGALAVADVYVGGVVIVKMFGDGPQDEIAGWAISIGTSAALLAVWGFIFTKKKFAWLLAGPAIVASVLDVLLDGRFVTLKLYSQEVVMNTGLVPPDATFAWWILEALVLTITLFNEGIIAMIFVWLFAELNSMVKKPQADKA